MRELSFSECHYISGATYESWQVVLLSGLSSGLAFGTIEVYSTLSIIEGLKLFAVCTIPTALTSAAIVGGFALWEMASEWDNSMAHC
ncbi:MAG: hypothetical protein AB7V32_09370 [Candidatus Berkiella sp.]